MTAPRDPIEAPANPHADRLRELRMHVPQPGGPSLLDEALAWARDEGRRQAVRLLGLAPPDSHCASDCCDQYPRLHLHGNHDEWNELVARHGRSSDPEPAPERLNAEGVDVGAGVEIDYPEGHGEGLCGLCAGWHDAEEVAFMNARRAGAVPALQATGNPDREGERHE